MVKESLFGKEPSRQFQMALKEHGEVYTNPSILRQTIENHFEKIQEATKQNEFINLHLAEKIREVCLILINEYKKVSHDEQRYINATINYFVDINDEEDDLYSPLGFDDDAEIVNECLELIGKEDLTIDIQ
ncbi:hypothetical protein [Halobacillus litoralis]|uniref:hypothetical protein n=1 Tax=Halobacillus litoralis TaxID=45668 RepID=UPI00136E3B35|nr:hypothetical protein [Halobacillus litoralis]MYL37369.1 hypothetical protein [Halobacillus litoralis]